MLKFDANLFSNIPLYKDFINEDGLSISKIKSLPFFSKEDIARDFPSGFMNADLKNAINDSNVEYATTSGTSGLQLNIIREKNWWIPEYQQAYSKNKQLSRIIDGNRRIAFLTTAVCSSGVCHISNPSYQERINFDFLSLNLTADPNSWTKEDILRMHNEIVDYSPGILQADPLYLLIFLMKWHKYFPDKILYQPSAIVLSYEYLHRGCKKFISDNYRCEVFSAFGSTELGFLFIEDENHDLVRTSESEIIEFIPVCENIYEVVVTSWKNKYMPFVRYTTGDLIELGENTALADGGIDFNKIGKMVFHGRKRELINGINNQKISISMIDDIIFNVEPDLVMYKIKIIKSDSVIIEGILKDRKPKERLALSFSKALSSFDTIFSQVKFIKVNSISPSTSGKFSLITY
ncbi:MULTISPECIES: hypothetical protein [Dickeya]|uniref:hypothetical protein n=1 Tax=Dickeya TaxID=204037 RepID=UPI0002F01140|nr:MULTISPECIES: hypothetical protein [Dickeya]AJC68478.1 hypothetical protein W909_17345 [Dickeya zeae EC1]